MAFGRGFIMTAILSVGLLIGILMFVSVLTGFNDWEGLGKALGPLGELVGKVLDSILNFILGVLDWFTDLVDTVF